MTDSYILHALLKSVASIYRDLIDVDKKLSNMKLKRAMKKLEKAGQVISKQLIDRL